MPASLRCPTCSAPLDLPPEHASTLRCPYCGAGVLLTERFGNVEAAAPQGQHTDAIAEVLRQLRAGSKIGAIKVYRERFGVGLAEAKYAVERIEAGQPSFASAEGPAGARTGSRRAAASTGSQSRAGLGCGLMLLLIGLMAGLFVMRGRSGEPAPTPAPGQTPVAAAPSAPRATPEAPAENGFATEVMRFGAEGTGAGRFQDARSVAVDGAGRIYVAEYSGGRVQVFDSAGTFLTQWMADPRMPLVDMAADRGGTVYIVQSGRIRRFEGATGRALGEWRSQDLRYEDVTVALDGSLWAVSDDEVMHLSRDGAVERRIDIKEAVDEDADPARVAVSGTGELYVLDHWKAHVYHLNPQGRFVDRFGGGGFPAPEDVAVDGRGRVYVSDLGSSAIQVFDGNGQPVGSVGQGGVVFGITFNDRDELFAAYRNAHAIVKFRINP
jgi:sugar lactone lactonase YvrE/DNA-directed RNA polymerase subunit RPC12/RpoP